MFCHVKQAISRYDRDQGSAKSPAVRLETKAGQKPASDLDFTRLTATSFGIELRDAMPLGSIEVIYYKNTL